MVLLSVTLACQSRTAADSGELRVVLHPAEGSARPARVELAGLSDDEVSALRSRSLDDGDVGVVAAGVGRGRRQTRTLPAVAGHYAITGGSVTFTPLLSIRSGRAYRVRVDPSKLRPAVGRRRS